VASCLSTEMAMQMSQQVSYLPPELSTQTVGPFLCFRGNSADLSVGSPAWCGAHAYIVPLTRLSAANTLQCLSPPLPTWQGAEASKHPWQPEQGHCHAPGSEAALAGQQAVALPVPTCCTSIIWL